jgi:YfiH family protein
MIHAASLAFPNIRHAFFTREGGVSSGIYESLNGGLGSKDSPANVTENRTRMARMLGVAPTHFISCYQIHSPDVMTVTEPWTRENTPRADAIVTKTPGIAIGVGAADCGPILFADGEAGVVGAAHAGWKGALTGVGEATIDAMEKIGAQRSRIRAAIGPLIRQTSYEVGPEFVQRFTAVDAVYETFFIASARASHAMFDLPGFIKARLEGAGIAGVEDLGLDTYADERFFSYRRTTHRGEPDYGRHIHAISLAG